MHETDLLALLYRLRTGFVPGPYELTGADLVHGWAVLATIGPFVITGTRDGAPLFAVLLALDDDERWGLLTDGWVRLGARAGLIAPSDAVLRRAVLWLAEGARMDPALLPHPASGEAALDAYDARCIGAVAALLAIRAERVGLDTASTLLRMAALEANEPQPR